MVIGGCQPLPPLRAEGARVRIFSDADPPSGLVEWLDHAVTSYDRALGNDAPREPISIAIYEPSGVDDICGLEPAVGLMIRGCAPGSTTHQNSLYMPHELVHAVASQVGSGLPVALSEGLADALGCGHRGGYAVPIDPDPLMREWLTDGDLFRTGGTHTAYGARARNYPVAASFVRFLIDLRGMEGIEELLRSSGSVEDRLERVYGRSATRLIDDWAAEGARPVGEVCELVPECALPRMSNEVTTQLRPGEVGIAFLGGRSTGRHLGTIELDAAVDLLFTLRLARPAESAARLALLPCGDLAPERIPDLRVAEGSRASALLVRLNAGTYSVFASSQAPDSGDGVEVTVEWQVLPSAISCGAATSAVMIPADVETMVIAPETDLAVREDEYLYDFTLASPPREARISSHFLITDGAGVRTVETCMGCPAECALLHEETEFPQDARPVELSDTTPTRIRFTPTAFRPEVASTAVLELL